MANLPLSSANNVDAHDGLLLNFHRVWTTNIGDLASAPLNYLRLSSEQQVLEVSGQLKEEDPRATTWKAGLDRIEGASAVIVGGGGLMEFDKHWPALEALSKRSRRAVMWGAGSNSTNSRSARPYFEKDYSGFALIGCRDFGYEPIGFQWVPCASCLHPAFDREYKITREVVYFGNVPAKGSLRDLEVSGFGEDNVKGNAKTTVDEVVAFLASARLVVSSSYHGCYWATLLGREVIAVGRKAGYPRSSKFYAFRHPAVLADSKDWRSRTSEAKSYPTALTDCREANFAFAQRVRDLLLK